jgi:hypothetical protein
VSKVSVVVAAAAGYVMGARAGRERYEQIVATTRRFWNDPRVQRQASAAVDLAKDKAPEVGAALSSAAQSAASKVTPSSSENGRKHSSNSTSSSDS